jgi:diacylglycerol kinase family enzyme
MTILLNQRAGRAQRARMREQLVRYVRERGIEAVVHEVRAGEEITSLARQAVLSGERTVVAAGGDGTASAVAAALADTEATMAVLPVGTLNHFAKELGIPLELEAAVEIALTGAIRAIDVGEVNGRVFVNNSSLGLYPAIVFARERRRRRGWSKWLAMAWASLSVPRRFPSLSVSLEAGGSGACVVTPFLFVGNNEYVVEGFRFGRRRSLDEGRLWVFVAPPPSSRWRAVRLTLRALFKRDRRDRDFNLFQTRELRVETTREQVRVALDGEIFRVPPPLQYRSRPLALRVRVPAGKG